MGGIILKQLRNITFVILAIFTLLLPQAALAAKDNVKPTISGAKNKTVYIGTSFNPKTGVTANDDIDGNITNKIKISGKVNMKKPGKYKLTYSVSDKAKNKTSITRTITVKKDTVKPKISGATNKTVYIGSSFNPKTGVTAKDNADGNITKKIKISGKVIMKKAGKYKLTYSVSDKAKNKASVTRTITVKKDTVKPKISGATNKTVYIGSSFNPKTGVTAKDNADGNITKKIKISGKVIMKKAGKYKLTYSVSDKAKNKASVTRTITVKKDTVKPKISGATNKSINIGTAFNPKAGVTASDNIDGNITKNIKIKGLVNSKKAGVYTLTYTVSDKAKNTTTVKRTITVKDHISPVISGVQDTKILVGDTFDVLKGITAFDNNDGNITSKIKIEGSVNTNKAGTYELTYSVSDTTGNTAKSVRMVTVIDNVKPVISGVNDLTINFGEKFNLLEGVTASDNSDGDITSKIKVEGSVDTNKAGIYELIYSVTDESGNSVTAARKVTVVDHIKPVISGVENLTIGLYTKFDLSEGVSAIDNNDGNITSSIQTSGSVDTNTEGSYVITYKVADAAGNITEVKRTITVKKIPVSNISIKGPAKMRTGKSQQFEALINPMDATDKTVTWESSDNSVATVDNTGMVTTISEGTVTIKATADGVTASHTLTISDQPNLYLYKSGSSTINNLLKSFTISMYNLENAETVYVEKVEIFEEGRSVANYSAEKLESEGINTTLNPRSEWKLSLSFKYGIWAGKSKAVVTVRTENNTSYNYSVDL